MNSSPGQALEDQIGAITLDWVQRLRGEPALSTLGRRDTVCFLIEATLHRLCAGVTDPNDRSWLDHCRPQVAPAFDHCACGLEPMRRYFATGEAALGAVLSEIAGMNVPHVIALFRELAAHEQRNLCESCRGRGLGDCLLCKTPPPAPA